jgi:hypothetical protein
LRARDIGAKHGRIADKELEQKETKETKEGERKRITFEVASVQESCFFLLFVAFVSFCSKN